MIGASINRDVCVRSIRRIIIIPRIIENGENKQEFVEKNGKVKSPWRFNDIKRNLVYR